MTQECVRYKWCSRKLWVSIGLHGVNVALLAFEKIGAPEFVTLTLFVFGGYVMGNLGEHGVKAVADRIAKGS